MQNEELFVVDVNVVISAVFNKGDSLNVFFWNALYNKFNFIAPQFLYIELGKHTDRIARETKYSLLEATKILKFVIKQIKFVSDTEFSDKIEEAKKILKGHEKDVPYLALALKFNCIIFSGDKELKRLIPDKVKTPKELLEEFYSETEQDDKNRS